MFKLFNLEKGPNHEPDISEEVMEEKEEVIEEKKIDPLGGMSLQEKSEALKEKKNEIEELNQERIDYHVEAKNFEEAMTLSGISDEQKQNIREQIMSEGGEIADKIKKIRDEYGLEPTPVEVYSTRIDMLTAEAERIKNNLNYKYKKLLDYLEKMNAEMLLSPNHLLFLENRFNDFEEVTAFVNKVRGNGKSCTQAEYTEFVDSVRNNMQAGSKYKTPGEIRDALDRLDKVNKLIGLTDSELHDAKNKEGRFDNRA